MNLNSNSVEQENWLSWQSVFMPEFMFCEKMVSGALRALHYESCREYHERGVSDSKGREENKVFNLNGSVQNELGLRLKPVVSFLLASRVL